MDLLVHTRVMSYYNNCFMFYNNRDFLGYGFNVNVIDIEKNQ